MQSKLVGWNNAYSLNMPELDAQHKLLFDLINKLWQGIVSNAAQAAQLALVEQLERYTQTHFAEEEAFMQAVEYPSLSAHRQSHRQFVQRIAAEKQALAQGSQISLDLLHFLNNWLGEHILGEDREYADYSERRKERSILGKFFRIFS